MADGGDGPTGTVMGRAGADSGDGVGWPAATGGCELAGLKLFVLVRRERQRGGEVDGER